MTARSWFSPRNSPPPLAAAERRLKQRLERTIAASTAIVGGGAATWLVVRHLAGGLHPPSPAAGVVLVASATAVALLVRRRSNLKKRTHWPALCEQSFWLHPTTTPLALLALAVSFPRAAPWSSAAHLLLLLAGEAAWRLARRREADKQSRRPDARPANRSVRTATKSIVAPGAAGQNSAGDRGVENRSSLPTNVEQRLVRERRDGCETAHGMVRCRFAIGEQNQNAHLAFCPPLETLPTITVRQISGPSATVKVGTAQTFGARFELHLTSRATAPQEVVLAFEATSAAPEK